MLLAVLSYWMMIQGTFELFSILSLTRTTSLSSIYLISHQYTNMQYTILGGRHLQVNATSRYSRH